MWVWPGGLYVGGVGMLVHIHKLPCYRHSLVVRTFILPHGWKLCSEHGCIAWLGLGCHGGQVSLGHVAGHGRRGHEGLCHTHSQGQDISQRQERLLRWPHARTRSIWWHAVSGGALRRITCLLGWRSRRRVGGWYGWGCEVWVAGVSCEWRWVDGAFEGHWIDHVWVGGVRHVVWFGELLRHGR